jgi:SET domain
MFFATDLLYGMFEVVMPLSEYIGLLAGVFQLVAYLVYIRYFLKDAIRPNATSWVMFAYGTALMLFLEWQGGATWDLLVLPFVCAFMSLFVAVLCMRSRYRMQTGLLERSAFGADVGLTMGYLGLKASPFAGPLFNTGFIVAGNLTTITAFLPILYSTWKSPENEKGVPWVFWALAYGLLIISTLLATGLTSPALLIYPVLNFFVHGGMAFLILKTPKIDREFLRNDQNVYVALSQIEGLGIFAATAFETGAPICVLVGEAKSGEVPMEMGPNWVGVGKNEWIDPDDPVDHLNHSCDPNAAFSEGLVLRALRPIARDEEVTMDYSTTEADLTWRMNCACGVPTCRKTLTSIQTAFAGNSEAPKALPAMQEIWREYQRAMTPSQNQTQIRLASKQVSELV